MTVEANYEFQLGETWVIPFESDDELDGAVLEFALSQGDVKILSISDADSPSVFTVDSPPINGSVEIGPERQDYSASPAAGLAVSPGAWNYEIRADYSGASPPGPFTVLAYGKIIVQASLFAWPVS